MSKTGELVIELEEKGRLLDVHFYETLIAFKKLNESIGEQKETLDS